ncbi:MAG: T9SS type A sorting domain-containing protein, partial [Bacteroidia bacterium]
TVNYIISENADLKIFDQYGKLSHVQTLNYAKQSEKIDISSLSSGTYFYFIQDINGNSKTEKLVVIK